MVMKKALMQRWGWTAALLVILFAPVLRGTGAEETAPARIRDVIYGRKHGVVLTLDVLKPGKPNGIGVLWMVSGGWFSAHEAINPPMMKGFLDRGQTVFAVVHGSQPKYTIPEILQDVERATRYVRTHAAEYGVDPDRLGIAGGSAGGHLSLMQGARGRDGDAQAKDPVDRASSRVQAVACFFPPTDFLNYGKPGENALTGEVLKRFRPAFGLKSQEPAEAEATGKAISPLYSVTKDMPPSLIIHGDADVLVPIQQAHVMMKRLEEVEVPHRLVVREGKGHGWPTLGEDITLLAEWFEQHLRKK
jgi:acetyl esterase/lipase